MVTKHAKSTLLAGSLWAIAVAIPATAAAPAPVAAENTPIHLAQAAGNPCGPGSPCAPGRAATTRGNPCGPASPVQATTTPVAAAKWPDSFTSYLATVRKSIRTTDMDGYLAIVKNPGNTLLLDVREDAEFKAGHVPGTVNIPRGLLEFQIWAQLGYPKTVDMNHNIYVQCRTGGRATLATNDLRKIGFTNVTAVIMDFQDWKTKGNPINN